jgi:hypothetical protein
MNRPGESGDSAIAGAAERAAASAGIPGHQTARGNQRQLDSLLARRGEAGAQAGHGLPSGGCPALGQCGLGGLVGRRLDERPMRLGRRTLQPR